jgi:penicillin-insensitive murein endopeptidase
LAIFNKSRTIILGVGLITAAAFYVGAANSGSVTCNGTTAATKPMPITGENFSSYCLPCIAALRTYARNPVIDTVVAAYADLARSHPQTHFLYGEIGFPDGGRFRPHKTHREGLSVDLMVPLKAGKVMSANALNRYGYDVEFDTSGIGEQGEIDFGSLNRLIGALNDQARKRGGKIRRIFFAPDLQPALNAADSKALSGIRFNKLQSWVRHDDHIHVDFTFPCSAG